MIPASFDYHAPKTLPEALALLGLESGAPAPVPAEDLADLHMSLAGEAEVVRGGVP